MKESKEVSRYDTSPGDLPPAMLLCSLRPICPLVNCARNTATSVVFILGREASRNGATIHLARATLLQKADLATECMAPYPLQGTRCRFERAGPPSCCGQRRLNDALAIGGRERAFCLGSGGRSETSLVGMR